MPKTMKAAMVRKFKAPLSIEYWSHNKIKGDQYQTNSGGDPLLQRPPDRGLCGSYL
jgi:hypothetical protein